VDWTGVRDVHATVTPFVLKLQGLDVSAKGLRRTIMYIRYQNARINFHDSKDKPMSNGASAYHTCYFPGRFSMNESFVN
jgi:hypothetical protein